ncbi:penicillin-binding protein 1A [Tissierella creatinophila]|uniref:Penicillin-binding protein 1A n=1 Tax=Tissierella creatinophila DSM 6911 TaxID=1123403 RepID=A0A1U7M6P0_TISCR|nr:PBP1A family penicillin-binding protein [Tissierella creatinophila]OLS02858.1 penicillin-binding protein 1A [Tissierella creatinophila DSM 6911]
MSKDNNENKKNTKDKNRKKSNFMKSLKIFLILILLFAIIAGGVLGGIVISIIKEAPEIDPTKINSSLSQTSTIYDSNEKLIEKIDTGEYRTFVSLNKMPKHLLDAFISIEDERFNEHKGIDPKGIVGSLFENLKSDGIVRGASTITQQLVKNVYLTNEQKLTRKIKEAYLSLQVEKVLHKDQILEAYLNGNFFGQNAAGVQEAAQTYFSKNVEDLTLAESALFAGIVKSPTQYQPFIRVKPNDYDSEKQATVGEINVLGEKYILVFNEKSVERQKLVLKKMLELNKITQAQYDEALKEDIKTTLTPGQKKLEDITSYFTDYVKSQVVTTLVNKLDYSKEDAEEALYKGGLKIYSTVDLSLQKELEDVYNNFTEVLVGNSNWVRGPVLIDWRLNKYGNIIDDKGKILYLKKNNLLDEEDNLMISKGNYSISENGDITIKSNNKLSPYPKHIDIADYYTIDERKNLVTHTVGSFDISEEDFKSSKNGDIIITNKFLNSKKDFYKVSDNGNLLISGKYFYNSKDGIVQPQSATVILDYRTGQIKAIVGGRDVEGNRILNRATNSQRQPGSVIKPLSAYLPALDNGYTAGSAIDDTPYYDGKGKLWPKNSYSGYKGMRTLRSAVEDSGNVPAVRTVENIGIDTSISYLEKLGIINKKNGEKDNFVTRANNKRENDENFSALALGGMTYGLTPLEVTAAYGAIANNGVYIEPIAFTKILDKDGNVLLENTPRETTVVSPQVAYIMGDVLRTNVSDGIGKNARLSKVVAAGKTGTTQNKADIWFVGFTPYYATGVWIGNDSPKITLNKSSMTAAEFWQHIMTKAHKDLESKYEFDKPSGILSANICTQSGKLATTLCAQDPRDVIKTEIFAKGTVPTQYCDVHTIVRVDTSTGKIANQYCPDSLISSRVYIKRTPPYKPWENGGIIPRDYAYNAPTSICTVHGPHTIQPSIPSTPDEDGSSKPDEDNNKPSKPEDDNNTPSKPEDDNNTPSKPEEEEDNKPSKPEDNKPSKPGEGNNKPSNP